MITAYIDFKTKYVYTFINIIAGCFGVVSLISKSNSISDFISSIVYISCFTFVTVIFTKLNAYGAGDNDMYIVVSFFHNILTPQSPYSYLV